MNLDVAIIDYRVSNLFSVHSACNHFGVHSKITQNKDEILNARSVILPGVGAFGPAIKNLTEQGLIPIIHQFIETGKPFLGICLGMQLLMDESEELGMNKGLGIVSGVVKKFSEIEIGIKNIKIPHIGWNRIKTSTVKSCDWSTSLLRDINDNDFMYFSHSLYVLPEKDSVVATFTDYGDFTFCSSLIYKNIFASQFHIEKSGEKGLGILKNFLGSVKEIEIASGSKSFSGAKTIS